MNRLQTRESCCIVSVLLHIIQEQIYVWSGPQPARYNCSR